MFLSDKLDSDSNIGSLELWNSLIKASNERMKAASPTLTNILQMPLLTEGMNIGATDNTINPPSDEDFTRVVSTLQRRAEEALQRQPVVDPIFAEGYEGTNVPQMDNRAKRVELGYRQVAAATFDPFEWRRRCYRRIRKTSSQTTDIEGNVCAAGNRAILDLGQVGDYYYNSTPTTAENTNRGRVHVYNGGGIWKLSYYGDAPDKLDSYGFSRFRCVPGYARHGDILWYGLINELKDMFKLAGRYFASDIAGSTYADRLAYFHAAEDPLSHPLTEDDNGFTMQQVQGFVEERYAALTDTTFLQILPNAPVHSWTYKNWSGYTISPGSNVGYGYNVAIGKRVVKLKVAVAKDIKKKVEGYAYGIPLEAGFFVNSNIPRGGSSDHNMWDARSTNIELGKWKRWYSQMEPELVFQATLPEFDPENMPWHPSDPIRDFSEDADNTPNFNRGYQGKITVIADYREGFEIQ